MPRRDREDDLERELRAHLELEAEERREAGLSAEQAGYAARRALGNTAWVKEEVRIMWGWNWLGVLAQDLRYAGRQLRRSPGFAAVAILTLALGIGANTAIFSVMNAVMLRYLPVRDPQRLVFLNVDSTPGTQSGDGSTSITEPAFEQLRAERGVLSELVAFVPLSFNRVAVRYGAVPEEAQVDMVSGDFFSGLGVPPARGRTLRREEEIEHAAVAVMSYAWWTRRFGRDPAVIGQPVYVKGVPFTIIGIAAPGFAGLEHTRTTDIWIPLQDNVALKPWGIPAEFPLTLYGSPNWWCLKTVGRLAPGVSPAQALATLNPALQRVVPAQKRGARPPQLSFASARGIEGLRDELKEPLSILMAMVGLVLAIACTNVALLLVARNGARQREFALRMALGGNRARLFRQLLTEGVSLVAAGALLGWFFALWATGVLSRWAALEVYISPDRSVLLFALAASLAAGLVFGLAPLGSAARVPIGAALKSASAAGGVGRHQPRGSRVVVAGQISLCLVLLVCAGLLTRSLLNLQATDLGMRASGLMVFGISPVRAAHSDAETVRFYQDLLARMRALPGVESATLISNRLGSGWSNNSGVLLDGGRDSLPVRWNVAGPDCFHVLGIPLRLGRDFTDADAASAPRVAIVNETFVKRYLADRFPLGHTLDFRNGAGAGPFTIVGVAADSKFTGVSDVVRPTASIPYPQTRSAGMMHVELRSSQEPAALWPEVRRAVAGLGPDLAPLQPMTQQEQFEESYSQQRLFARLSMFFGLLAALLVATGLYGTLAYTVSRRTSEVGVRMALGARRGQVLWMVLRGSLLVSLAGITAGLPLAVAGSHLLQSMLYGVKPGDPWSYAAALAGIVGVALLASWIPARRAASVDPTVALRQE